MRLYILAAFILMLVTVLTATKKDYYSTLGVSKTATNDELKAAWKMLSSKYLFEKFEENENLAKLSLRTRDILEAWEVLGSEKLRRLYDKKGEQAWTGSYKPGKLGLEALQRREEKEEGKVIIGIDLGFSHGSVAIYSKERKDVEIIEDLEGRRKVPNAVGFLSEGGHLIGHPALNYRMENPDKAIVNVQRLIGKTFAEVEHIIPTLEFKVEESNLMPMIKVDFGDEVKMFTPEEITALLLDRLKTMAEWHLEQRVEKAVITVPAHFTDSQRKATIDAATIAGLQVVRLINEPTAVAIAYSMGDKELGDGDDKNILVICLNNGFLDVALVEIDDGSVEVLASESVADIKMNKLEPVSSAIDRILLKADITKKDISEVVTSSLMISQVKEHIANYFEGRTFSSIWTKSSKDEAAAEGAAIQAAVLGGKMKSKDALIIDVTTHSLGIEVNKGAITEMIPRNTQLPAKKLKPFRVPADKDHTFTFDVFEGEEALTQDNHKLGKFNLSIPQGVTDADVKFEISLDGILKVTAKEAEDSEDSERKVFVELKEETGLSRDEVEQLSESQRIVSQKKRQRKARWDLERLIKELEQWSETILSDNKLLQEALKAANKWLEENPEASAFEMLEQELVLKEFKSDALTNATKEEL